MAMLDIEVGRYVTLGDAYPTTPNIDFKQRGRLQSNRQ
jgi:hypothetical protein